MQGEGLYVGKPQVFIRFYGCNLACSFCDTKPENHEIFTVDSLIDKISGFREPYHSISLTGGEPLLQADFIVDFLRNFSEKSIYLETNGVLYGQLSKVIDYVDIIAMDFKLPSSAGCGIFWEEHEKFLKLAKRKEVFVKAVITDATAKEDISRMLDIIKKTKDVPIVLQPVTPLGGIEAPGMGLLNEFKDTVTKSACRVEVIPQVHRLMGVR